MVQGERSYNKKIFVRKAFVMIHLKYNKFTIIKFFSMKNYELIAEKFLTYAVDSEAQKNFFEHLPEKMADTLDIFIDTFFKYHGENLPDELQDLFVFLLGQSFMQGLVLWGLEHDCNLTAPENFNEDKLPEFFLLFEDEEKFNQSVDQFPFVSECILSKNAKELMNNIFVHNPEFADQSFNDVAAIENHLVFGGTCGYLCGKSCYQK